MLEPFGEYLLFEKLAEGGMAEIFLAKQTGIAGFERNVVIKRMLPNISRQKRFVTMFLDEARLAARLAHPNIIAIFDVGHVGDSYFIAMEYLPGADLGFILQKAHERGLMLPIDVALRIVIAAAAGLHHAHELCTDGGKPLNIVHRDVSPNNIYVSFDGQVKVLDFGIAKAESRVSSTAIGTVKGKTHYIAPEQGRAAPVDRRVDVYSLGVTLYEALTVWPPFLRENVRATFEAVLKNEYRPPRLRRPEIPQLVERACMRAMSLAPDDRHATCAELADELAGALDTSPPKGADPLIGAFLRELLGEEEVARRSRIPSLSALQELPAHDVAARPSSPWRWRVLAGVAALLVLFVAAWRISVTLRAPVGCGTVYGADGPRALRLGASLPLSVDSGWKNGDLALVDALRLAVDDINGAGGVAGRRLALALCDNAGDLTRLKAQARWLMERRHVPVLITSWSSLTLAAANLTVPRGVLVMTADATSPELAAMPATGEGGVRLLWRTAPSDALQAALAAQLIASDRDFATVKRVGVLYQDDLYGQGWAGVLRRELLRLRPGVSVQAIQFPFRGAVDSAVAQLAAVKPDVTVLVSFPLDAARVLNLAARTPGLTRADGNHWLFCDAIKEPSLLTALAHPDEIDGAYGIESADGGGPEAASFQTHFFSRFQRSANEQAYAANRYDAVYLLALGAAWAAGRDDKGAITGARIARGLTHLSSGPRFSLTPEMFPAARAALSAGQSIDVVGASGELDFDEAVGEAHGPVRLWRVQGQRLVSGRRLQ
jgi:serine/threonine protein kinase/ABC-type branched-subunit amino acid transport system substrate-binding protein